ncbi:2-oxoglutarate dehydrogenase complex component E1 [Drosophila nasuta]|uniref:2-oxoglutarate dehydrogenase complex component E1 n=1 Tax=Drosophila nasuta TaxID=42062 RepID=UPI00295F4208|nr:2-oxoglutarate dehydrogenase complex component E1 [Drosophila nasuta]
MKINPIYGFRNNCMFINRSRQKLHGGAVLAAKSSNQSLFEKNKRDSVINGSNAVYVEKLFSKWSRDPGSVNASWNAYFGGKASTHNLPQPKSRKSSQSLEESLSGGGGKGGSLGGGSGGGKAPTIQGPNADWKYIDDHLVVQAIIRAYQTRGHLAADLDPLGIVGPTGSSLSPENKKVQATKAVLRQHYYYTFNDLNAVFKLPYTTLIGGDEQFLPLQEILDRLERVYCGHIGVEYMMITSLYKCHWIRQHFEKPGAIDFKPEDKKLILERLTRSTGFENFLAKKFISEKRFGIEGCDILIPAMKEIVDESSRLGVESIFIGMAHRGRLNVLSNVCRKPIADILTQFHGIKAMDPGSGDVKYHLGVFTDRQNRQSNKRIRITVVANPSHLEFVNPVVLGKARAEMFQRGDINGDKVLPIILHGDASFCGQGIVFESIHMSELPAYTTYGTIHIVVNNQVGFTTDPRFSRSSRYCTDVARVLNAPIFHVNADDPEACIHCARVAAKWRAKFHKDVVIDLVGYRRNGHNEADEPMFTQPLMYQRIRKLKPVTVTYAEKLVREGVIKMDDYTAMVSGYEKICNEAFEESKKNESFKYSDWLDSPWPGFFQGRDRLKMCPTGVNVKVLEHIGNIYCAPPPEERNFAVHKGILRILGQRRKMLKDRIADWSLGEAFAFGTLLKDGIHVRVSGQDVERGTFSHRHHVLHHQKEDKVKYNPLQYLYPDQAKYDICNSSLSECGVLGFDLGYSMASPHTLVIWEAQFGDFANTAQPIFDTFLCSGETKWVRQTGLVVLLPHSMEGMGPEHSSGRIERFLQLSDDDPDVYPDTSDCDFVARQLIATNWIVTNLTTPANLFHALRRQVSGGFRKPLINFAPKSVLRHPMARSPFRDFNECSAFQRIIPETGEAGLKPECVKKLVFCSGKVYYDLIKERDDHEQNDTVAIVRIEQICPFPYDLITKQLELYKDAELIWAQEEHKNQGAWSYVQARFDTTILNFQKDTRCVTYHGRPPNSASSTGNKVQHYNEYNDIMNGIFGKLTEANKQRLADQIKAQQDRALKESAASYSKSKKEKVKKAEKKDDKPKQASGADDKKKTKSKKDEKSMKAASGKSAKDAKKKMKKAASPADEAAPAPKSAGMRSAPAAKPKPSRKAEPAKDDQPQSSQKSKKPGKDDKPDK